MLARRNLHLYQEECVEFLLANPFSALFISMGLGKTISSLTVITELLLSESTEKILVVAPLKVSTDTWPTEIGLWAHTAGVDFTLIRERDDDPRLAAARAAARTKARADAEYWGLPAIMTTDFVRWHEQRAETRERRRIREDLARSPQRLHIINREQLEWLIYFWKGAWPYRTVFIDESSSFKDISTGRWKALAKVRRIPGLITRMHLLTATPAAETYEHLFAQIYLLDLGERFGKGITRFRERYFTQNRYTMKWKLRPGAEEEILAKIADICLVMKAEDYLDQRAPTFIQRSVTLSPEQTALYEQMRDEFVVTLPDGNTVESETAAVLSQKLLQMASGRLYETYLDEDWETGDFKKIKRVHHLHDHKIEMLREIVEERQGEPLLVGYHFQSSLAALRNAFPKATVMDREAKCVKDWNAGKIPLLFVHPQSAGHGLNMQKGGRILVFYDLPWSLELYLQLIGRLARQGQTRQVLVMLLTATGTMDEVVWQALRDKDDAQEMMFVILKRLIRARRNKK